MILSQPTLILMMGVAASGKTTVSKLILERLHLTYLDNNFIVDAFYPDTRNVADYIKMRPLFYDILYRITNENLAMGNSVLLDAPHVKEMRDTQWQAYISEGVAKRKARLAIVRCFCDEQTLKKRIVARGEERDAWKLRNWQEFLKEQPLKVHIPFMHLDLNTDNKLDENAETAIRYIVGV